MNTTQTKDSKIQLRLTQFIRAKRSRVFAAWTQPELLKRWHAPGAMTVPNASSDLRVGGSYRIEMAGAPAGGDCGNSAVAGTYVKVVPDELLSFTWKWQEDPEAVETLVTVELKDVPGGTEVTLTHERFASEESRDKHQQGWGGCLENLAGLAARGGLNG